MRFRLAILSLFVSVAAFAQGACLPVGNIQPFRAGETLNYSISFKWRAVNTDVASAVVRLDSTLYRGESVYHASLSARTARFFEAFFKVRENFDGWFTIDGLEPRKFIRDTHEGNYYAYNLYTYDWSSRTIHAALDSKSHGRRSIDIPLPDCAFDLPALLYYCRCMDLSRLRQNSVYHLTFAIDDDVYVLTLSFKGRETIKLKGIGSVRCMRFSLTVVAGEMFEGDEDIVLWISDDNNRLPVYFKAPLKVGAVVGRMSSYEGLRNPFSSLINQGR